MTEIIKFRNEIIYDYSCVYYINCKVDYYTTVFVNKGYRLLIKRVRSSSLVRPPPSTFMNHYARGRMKGARCFGMVF